MSANLTLLCCLCPADAASVEAAVDRAAAALPPGCTHEVLLVGHGAPDATAAVVRALLARHPGWRALLLTRPGSRRAALAAARPLLRTAWFIEPGRDVAGDRTRWRPAAAEAGAGLRGLLARLCAVAASALQRRAL